MPNIKTSAPPQPPPAANITIDIAIEDERWEEYVPAARAHLLYLAAELSLPAGEISILLSDDARLAELNKTYRNKEGATNVLAFPADIESRNQGAVNLTPLSKVESNDALDKTIKNYKLLGDIALSYSRVAEETRAPQSFLDRATHLLTHGVLHLIGYVHDNERDAAIMEALEIKLLERCGIANPYEILPEAGDE